MKVAEKIDRKMEKVRYGVENTLRNPQSKIMCDKCHERLGIIHMLKKSVRVKKNTVYRVICRSCGHVNKRLKGAMGEEMEKTWKKYGTG